MFMFCFPPRSLATCSPRTGCGARSQLGDAFHTDFVGVTDQLVGRILEEMDYRNEAAYADQFGALYRSSEVFARVY